MNNPIIVADASPLIALAKCGQLDLLVRVFDAIHIPATVLHEATGNPAQAGAEAVAEFASRFASVHPDRDDSFFQDVRAVLDEGEAQALSLAYALNCGVLMDERRGRQVATTLGIPLFGVLGVLLQAKRRGIITAVQPILYELLAHEYRLSSALIAAVLKEAGE